MVGRVEVRSCIQMSLMYRSNSYIVHHCWFWARTMEFAFSLFRLPHHHYNTPSHLRFATTLRLCVFIATERFILNDKRLSYSQWFHAIFFPKSPAKSLCDSFTLWPLSTCNTTGKCLIIFLVTIVFFLFLKFMNDEIYSFSDHFLHFYTCKCLKYFPSKI